MPFKNVAHITCDRSKNDSLPRRSSASPTTLRHFLGEEQKHLVGYCSSDKLFLTHRWDSMVAADNTREIHMSHAWVYMLFRA